jgi:hypothetical protein
MDNEHQVDVEALQAQQAEEEALEEEELDELEQEEGLPLAGSPGVRTCGGAGSPTPLYHSRSRCSLSLVEHALEGGIQLSALPDLRS